MCLFSVFSFFLFYSPSSSSSLSHRSLSKNSKYKWRFVSLKAGYLHSMAFFRVASKPSLRKKKLFAVLWLSSFCGSSNHDRSQIAFQSRQQKGVLFGSFCLQCLLTLLPASVASAVLRHTITVTPPSSTTAFTKMFQNHSCTWSYISKDQKTTESIIKPVTKVTFSFTVIVYRKPG